MELISFVENYLNGKLSKDGIKFLNNLVENKISIFKNDLDEKEQDLIEAYIRYEHSKNRKICYINQFVSKITSNIIFIRKPMETTNLYCDIIVFDSPNTFNILWRNFFMDWMEAKKCKFVVYNRKG